MIAATMVADLDAVFCRQGNQGFNPPITRIIPHLNELLLGYAQEDMIPYVVLRGKRKKQFMRSIDPADFEPESLVRFTKLNLLVW